MANEYDEKRRKRQRDLRRIRRFIAAQRPASLNLLLSCVWNKMYGDTGLRLLVFPPEDKEQGRLEAAILFSIQISTRRYSNRP